MMDMLLRTYEQELQWASFIDKKKLLTGKLNCEQKKQIIKSTVCSRDLDID